MENSSERKFRVNRKGFFFLILAGLIGSWVFFQKDILWEPSKSLLKENSLETLIGKKIDPRWILFGEDGKEFSLDGRIAGQKALVLFWATWCGPCVEELPQIVQLEQEFKKKDIHIFSVNCDEIKNTPIEIQQLKRWLKQQDVTRLPWGIDSDLKILRSLGIQGLPFAILVNKSGNIEDAWSGAVNWKEWISKQQKETLP